MKDFANCFTDYRNPGYTEHTVQELFSQRIYGICLGYEDLNDQDRLRNDPLFAAICGKEDAEGERRKSEKDRGKALAGKSTLQRLETGGWRGKWEREIKKIVYNGEAIENYFVELFLTTYGEEPKQIL